MMPAIMSPHWNDWAFIALGSNLGPSATLLRQALAALAAESLEPVRTSSLWVTAPVDCPPGSAPFLNAVAALRPAPDLAPEALLDRLQALERAFGRKPKVILNEPRPLDLDLIAFGTRRLHTTRLTLPHPRARQRRFVLAPWAEIAPDFVPPDGGETVAALLAALPGPADGCRRLEH